MRTVLAAWADNAVEFATVLAAQDPTWGSDMFDLAGGRVALCGPGMWINRAYGIGIDHSISDDDLDVFEHRCATVGVRPAIEVSPLTSSEVVEMIARRGYRSTATVSALRHDLADLDALPATNPEIVVEPAAGQVAVWQDTAALGWGYADTQRRANDAFSRAAAVVDGEGFVLARDAGDHRPVGCASLTVRREVATLGGMSTLPQERRRGVQSALIVHRLRASRAAQCHVAVSTTAPRSDSERNLVRHGFDRWFELSVWTLDG